MGRSLLSVLCSSLAFAAGIGISWLHGVSTTPKIDPAVVSVPGSRATSLSFRAGTSWESEATPASKAVALRLGGKEFVCSDGTRLNYSFEEFESEIEARRALHHHARSLRHVSAGLEHATDGYDHDARIVGEMNGRRAIYWTLGRRMCTITGPSLDHVLELERWGV